MTSLSPLRLAGVRTSGLGVRGADVPQKEELERDEARTTTSPCSSVPSGSEGATVP